MSDTRDICAYVAPDGERAHCELLTCHPGIHLRKLDQGPFHDLWCCVRCGIVEEAHEKGRRRHAACRAGVLAFDLRARGLEQTSNIVKQLAEFHPTDRTGNGALEAWVPRWIWRLLRMNGTPAARDRVINLLSCDPVAQALVASHPGMLRRLLDEAMTTP